MLIPLFALTAGILAAGAGADIFFAAFFLVTGCLVYLFLLYKGQTALRSFKLFRYHLVWPAFIFFSIGILTADFNRPFLISGESSGYSEAVGRVTKLTSATRGEQLEVEVLSLRDRTGRILKTYNLRTIIYTDVSAASIDDIIRFPAKFERIEDSSNHFYSGYDRMLSNKGLNYCANVEGNKIAVVDYKPTLVGKAKEIRDKIESHIESSGISRHTQNLLITILLGDRQYLEPATKSLFADAGISHILALSGLHVTIIVGIVFFMLFPMNFAGLYKERMFAAIIILWGYTFISGLPLSAVRASLMLTFVVIAILLERKRSALNALCLSIFIILLFSPLSIYDAGLQLSVVCVASLILFTERLNPVDRRTHPHLYKISGIVIATLVTTGASWVLTVFYFRQFPVMFFIVNLITLPFLPLYLVASIVYLFLYAFGFESLLYAEILDRIPEFLEKIIAVIVDGDNAILRFSISSFTVILWLVAVVVFAMWINLKKYRKIYLYTAISIGLIAFASIPFSGEKIPTKGFIVCNNYHDLIIRTHTDGKEEDFKVSRGSVSKIIVHGKTLISVDCNLPDDYLLSGNTYSNCDYLLLTGSLTENINDVISLFRPGMVVIHSTVRKEREKEIISACYESNLPCHSLRRDKALRVMID